MTKSILSICNLIAVSLIISILPVLNGCVSDGVVADTKLDGPFKNYDVTIRDSIMHRWGALLETNKTNRVGKVILQFHLNVDGTISDINVLEDSVGDEQVAICHRAVSSSAPFPHWPVDMLRMVGENYRVLTFTFNYHK